MRETIRWLGVALGFLVIVPVHVVVSLFGQRELVPPLFLAFMGRMAGLRVRTEGTPRKGALFLANHESWLDILALAGTTRSVFAGKSDLAGHPFLRWLCDQNDTLFLQRDRRQTVAQQVEEVRAALASRPLTIFPEGTTSGGAALLPFKSSLLSAGEAAHVTVQQVALDYQDAAEIAWGDEAGLSNVWTILARRRPVRLTIRFLEPLTGEAATQRKPMAAAAQANIAAALRL